MVIVTFFLTRSSDSKIGFHLIELNLRSDRLNKSDANSIEHFLFRTFQDFKNSEMNGSFLLVTLRFFLPKIWIIFFSNEIEILSDFGDEQRGGGREQHIFLK